MTKAEMVEKIAKDTKLPKTSAEKSINTLIAEIAKTLKKGNKVILIGFGTFSVSKRKARTGRNPRTGTTIKILAHKSPKFTAGKGLRNAVK